MDINEVLLIGRAGEAPTCGVSENGKNAGKQYASFSLCTNFQDGQATWHRVVGFGKIAEIMQHRVSKGTRIFVKGHLLNNPRKAGETQFINTFIAATLVIPMGEKEVPIEAVPLAVAEELQKSIPL